MCLDAAEKLEDLLDQNEIEGAMFKMKEDPRVTQIGKIICAKSIDEIPLAMECFIIETTINMMRVVGA